MITRTRPAGPAVTGGYRVRSPAAPGPRAKTRSWHGDDVRAARGRLRRPDAGWTAWAAVPPPYRPDRVTRKTRASIPATGGSNPPRGRDPAPIPPTGWPGRRRTRPWLWPRRRAGP